MVGDRWGFSSRFLRRREQRGTRTSPLNGIIGQGSAYREASKRLYVHASLRSSYSSLTLSLSLSLCLSPSLPSPASPLASLWQEISMQPGVLIDGEQCSRPQRLLRELLCLSFSSLCLSSPPHPLSSSHLSPDQPAAPFCRSLQLDRTTHLFFFFPFSLRSREKD